MEKLKSLNSLFISQKREWLEILTIFECKNKYVILDENKEKLYYAAEKGGSALSRIFLNIIRPFTIEVLDSDNKVILSVKRPFRFFLQEVKVFDHKNEVLGVVKECWIFKQRTFSVLDNNNNEIFQLCGPYLKPWTFFIKNNDIEYGKITKEWGGLAKEWYTDADTFRLMFPNDWDIKLKALFLGAAFLIDFRFFEVNS